MSDWQRQEWVDLMLDECETWAVIGLHDPRRTAYSIAELLQRKGKRIVPIHPLAEPVLGEQGYATLADVPFPVDVVDVFRRSSAAGEFADQAVAVGCPRRVVPARRDRRGRVPPDGRGGHADGHGHLSRHRVPASAVTAPWITRRCHDGSRAPLPR